MAQCIRKARGASRSERVSDFDAIVVGAGVVGLAVARALSSSGRTVLLLDGEGGIGKGTSSRNSEVIHAGIHYPVASNKARWCVEGRERLYDYCKARDVPHQRCGKLIFARHEIQHEALVAILNKGRAAGVADLKLLSAAEVHAFEPALECTAALFSPSTGIIDSHALMLALLGDAESNGATFAAGSPVSRVTRSGDDWLARVGDHAATVVSAPLLVNSAGLGAQQLAHVTEGLDSQFVPPLYLARGVYFSYSGRTPFSHLIYPVPEPGGLGLHLTLDLNGQARFGPDVEWIDSIDYSVDAARKPAFVAAAKMIWSRIDTDRLQPGYAGIRPKIVARGAPDGDFIVSGPTDHGCAGLVNLFGIESPGLTASLAIADEVARKLA